MKKVLKRFVAVLASVAIAFSIILPFARGGAADTVASVVASAEGSASGYVRPDRQDDIFAFQNGAMVNVTNDTATSCTKLGFKLNLLNSEYMNFADNENDEAWFFFTLYRDNGEEVAAKWKVLCVVSGSTLMWAHQVVEYDEAISYSDYLGITVDQNEEGAVTVADYRGQPDAPTIKDETYGTYVIDLMQAYRSTSPFVYAIENNLPTIGFYTKLESVNVGYFLELDYKFRDYVKTATVWKHVTGLIWKTEKKEIFDEVSGKIATPTRSVYDVVYNINAAGTMESEFDTEASMTRAQEILGTSTQKIKLEYLEQIGETPFAKKVEATVEIPMTGGVPALEDVQTALGKKLIVLDSPVSGFEYDETAGVWETRYNKNVWLETRTVDGNSYHQYLDINLTYAETFEYLRTEISADQYSYFWSQTVKKYPDLETYDPDEVYGYFGQAWVPDIPKLGSVNALFAELFNTETEIYNLLDYQSRSVNLTLSQYEALLLKYNYTWIDAAWKTWIGALTFEVQDAAYYIFYAAVEPRASISDSGSTEIGDDDGVFENKVDEALKKAMEEFGKYVQETQETTDKLLTLLGVIAGVALVGFLALSFYYVYSQSRVQKKKR